ncbi:MAG: hypothetical protein ACLGPL_07105 [Acidobacteriota bacterium]
MIDLKALWKGISKAGLCEKSLSQLSREEMLSLVRIFDRAVTGQEKTCGTCWYFGWKGLKPWCLHSDHSHPVVGWGFGIGCGDWSYEFAKELGPHKLDRKPRIDESDS